MRLLLLLAVEPGVYIVYHVYNQDKIEKEPAKLIIRISSCIRRVMLPCMMII